MCKLLKGSWFICNSLILTVICRIQCLAFGSKAKNNNKKYTTNFHCYCSNTLQLSQKTCNKHKIAKTLASFTQLWNFPVLSFPLLEAKMMVLHGWEDIFFYDSSHQLACVANCNPETIDHEKWHNRSTKRARYPTCKLEKAG